MVPLVLRLCFLLQASLSGPAQPAAPVERDGWIVPAPADDALPVWGIADGIRVALHPTPGPRGLIRIYAPYLNNPPDQVINFIAIEPIVLGKRGLSEMEESDFDHARGKQMWTTDELPADSHPPQSLGIR